MKNSTRFSGAISIAILAISLGALSACSKPAKVGLVYGDYRTNTITDISYLQLSTKVSEQENFLLTVEPSTPCVCWRDFKLVAENYIKENHVIIYHIKMNELGDDEFGLTLKEGYTSFAIFENGIVRNDIASDNGQTLKDDNAFHSFMSENVTLPTMYYVSLDDVDSMYDSESKSVIYFSRSNCPDCTYVDRHFLKDYSLSHRDSNKLYILDCESIGIREYDEEGNLTPISQIAWQSFKDAYGLSSLNNSKYGYDSGFVPTFLLLNKNEYLSGAVYFNDTIVENGTSYKISSSYYSESRKNYLSYLDGYETMLEGMTLSNQDIGKIGDYIYWKQELAAKYHNTLLEKFLNFALPYVNYKVR